MNDEYITRSPIFHMIVGVLWCIAFALSIYQHGFLPAYLLLLGPAVCFFTKAIIVAYKNKKQKKSTAGGRSFAWHPLN